VATADDWEITHAGGRLYFLSNRLGYDARQVTVNARSRTTGKPDADVGEIEEFSIGEYQIIGADERVTIDLEPRWPGAPLPFRLQIAWFDEYGERLVETPEVPSPSGLRPRQPPPNFRSLGPPRFDPVAVGLATRNNDTPKPAAPRKYAESMPDVDPREVFVVVGRNTEANTAMFTFLRAINLRPIEWSTAIAATGSGSPYIGDALEAAFARAKAVVVFMTPDDVAQIRPEYASGPDDPELKLTPQARPNVLFEAGMALGLHRDRTIIVELGTLRGLSDLAGRHVVRIDNTPQKRNELANRLKNAGCAVDTDGPDWYEAGDFTAPKVPSGLPTGRRLPSISSSEKKATWLDGRYLHRSSGSDKLQLTNVSGQDLSELSPQNTKELHGRILGVPVPKIPAGKTVTLNVALSSSSPRSIDLVIAGRTASGDEFSESVFLDLNG
jgi:predicted nucleotide-binding protein